MALRASKLAALAVAAALVPALTATAAPQPADVVPLQAAAATVKGHRGSAGIGDPYYPNYGNGGYNVRSYKIKVHYRPASDRLTGVTTIRARSTKALSRFNLDFVLHVRSVRVNGRAAKFSHKNPHELVVRPKHALKRRAAMRVVVRYSGIPSRVRVQGISPWHRGGGGAAAVGEPEMAAWWFPSNDHPRDKARFDISVTVPRGVEAISNGVLRSRRSHGATTTWHWREHKPMATYLAYFVAGQYTITSGKSHGYRYWNAVPVGNSATTRLAAADLRRTGEVIDFESKQFGRYPFDAIGGVATPIPLFFALETQTRPVYDQIFWSFGPNIYVVVHENAHQWFGDSVSVRNWRDIWLNEGFATFTEWLWAEEHGVVTGQRLLQLYYDSIPANDPFWDLRIGDPGKGNEFDEPVYDRGAMTLQALRNVVGDRDFRKILRKWVRNERYDHAGIADFKRLAEHVSDKDLDHFFRVWLYTGAKPARTRANGLAAATTGAQVLATSTSRALQTKRQLDAMHKLLSQRGR